MDEDKYSRIRVFTILGEHHCDDVDNDSELRLVCGCHIEEDVACIECDFRMLGVDDRRHRKNVIMGVVNNGVDGGVPDDMEIPSEVFLRLRSSLSGLYCMNRGN